MPANCVEMFVVFPIDSNTFLVERHRLISVKQPAVFLLEEMEKGMAFKMTLSCSKHAYEELVERQDLETFLRCHERAFAFSAVSPR